MRFGARAGLLLATLALLTLCLAASAQAAITHPYTGASFGPGGVGSGSFGKVLGVTVLQSSGDVLVLDQAGAANGRLYKFSAAGEPVDFSSTATNVIEGVGSANEAEEEIAVDESSGPDAGDIYVANNSVVRIYAESGAFLGELSGGEMCGVAVDPSGNVYVGIYSEQIVRRYAPSANPVTNADESGSIGGLGGICNIAADSAGDVYAAQYSGGVTKYDALQFGSLAASGEAVDAAGRTLAVDPTSGEPFIDEAERIAQYNGAAEPPIRLGTFGASGEGALSGSFGVGVDHASGEVYAANGQSVEIFGPGIVVASVSTEGASDVTGSEATLHGTVEPASSEITSCVFQYGSEEGALGQSAPCEPGAPYGGSTPVAVSAHLTGLNGGTVYYYRIAASGSLSGAEESFKTPGPSVSDESFANVSASVASVSAEVNPNGEPTSYRVEYGTSTAYGSSTSTLSVGAGESPVPVSAHLSELQSGTTYHFRFVASSEGGSTVGPELVLTTQTPGLAGLPDGRGYEMVTPVENEGAEAYVSEGSGAVEEDAISTEYPYAAAADGGAVAYVGSPTASGNGSQGEGEGNEFLARHNADGGWTQTSIQPNGYSTPVYRGFSPDLEHAVLGSREPLAAGAPVGGYEELYARENASGDYQPLFTGTPPNRSANEFGAPYPGGLVQEGGLGAHYAGASADYSHLLFEANDTLANGAVDPGKGADNLYESIDAQAHTVNVLPDGAAAPNAAFGALDGDSLDFDHVISADGSRVFWTDLNTGALYVREDGEVTKLIAEDATYLTASADGSRVLYTKVGDLYEENLQSAVTRDLAPGGEVLGLAGTSGDLEYVYLVAQGALAPGGTAGKSNLYLLHDGQTRFIAALGSENEEGGLASDAYAGQGVPPLLPWQADLAHRTAEATPSGHDLVFLSAQSLTGYDDRGPQGYKSPQVFVYDADSGALSCASCDPTGDRPTAAGTLLALSLQPTYQPRWISEDGSRVFFDSTQSLTTQAQDGRKNVYEWERDGAGSCTQANGCIYLISSGTSPQASYFIDASASGDDVFFITRSQLVSSDQNELNDVYDARVGATEGAAPIQCTGTGCQGVAASPPIFATPASTTYNGVGNFTPPPTPVAKPNPKKKTASCIKKKAKKNKKTKAKKSAKQAKAKSVPCKAKKAAKKAAKRARRGANGRGGR